MTNSKSALVTAIVHQLQKLRPLLCMVFNQEFEICFQLFFTSLFRNSIYLHSEARLSSIMQYWKKLLSFHYCLPKRVTNFYCCILNFHTLNYHNSGHSAHSKVSFIFKGLSFFHLKNELNQICLEQTETQEIFAIFCKFKWHLHFVLGFKSKRIDPLCGWGRNAVFE